MKTFLGFSHKPKGYVLYVILVYVNYTFRKCLFEFCQF